MDNLAGYTGMNQFGSGHFMEPPDTINCGQYDNTRHNVRTCSKKRKTSKKGNPTTSQAGGGRGGFGGCRGGSGGGTRVRRTDNGSAFGYLHNPNG